MGHVVRCGRGAALRFARAVRISGTCEVGGGGAVGSEIAESLLGSRQAGGGRSGFGLGQERLWSWTKRAGLGVPDGVPALEELGCGFGSSGSARRFSSSSPLFPPAAAGVQATGTEHGLGLHRRHTLTASERSAVRGDRGFAKAVALPPQMQKPMKLRVFMGSPGVIGEPWKPPPPPLPFLKRWFTKEGWKIRKQNVQGMLKTGFTLAKIRQKTKGYNQTKFYRDATDLYKEINSALAVGDRSVLRQLVTDSVLTTMKKELKHREQAWARVHWELVGPLKRIRTLQGRLIGIDQKNMDTAFAQLTLRIVSNQIFAAYDKQGKLVAGDLEKKLTVEDIWVFERQISHPELRWKLCGRLSV